MKSIRTVIFVDAPPDCVWSVLVDFDAYEEWNPLNVRASGRAAPGTRIPMTFRNPARDGATVRQTVTVTACEPGRRLEWVGRVPLLFRGRHVFELEPEWSGTRVQQGEDMSGLIPLAFTRRTIERRFVPAYEAANRALAARVAAAGRATPR